ncbi:MAG: GxxExxY protein [Ardenticatenaceae bacterium]|nr:GxxExxY protein [Ardenticatenaceae bacterium]
MVEIIHKELSYAVRGVLFDVHNQLGPLLPEKFYQEAVAIGLEANGLACQTEKPFTVYYCGVEVGRYFVDVWVEGGQLLLELKVAPEILPIHQAQAISYLKVTDADLAVVVNFGARSLEDMRLPNRVRGETAVPHLPTSLPPVAVPFPELATEIVNCLHRVHLALGPGFLHQVYRRATMVELREQSIGFNYIKESPIYYQGIELGKHETRLILVEDSILVAAFAVKDNDESLKARLRSQLRRHNKELGILANFYGSKLDISLVKRARTN